MIYCDQAATSWPKPPEVIEAVHRALVDFSASPGRSAHSLSLKAARVVFGAREAVAGLLGVTDSSRVVFTLNVTQALNVALMGLLAPGDHVLVTGLEHNAVMRPLSHLAACRGVVVDVLPVGPDGLVDADEFGRRKTDRTRMAVINHASNITGAIAPVVRIKERLGNDVLVVVDAAQSAGVLDLRPVANAADVLAFTGHKGLMGPTGTGGLWIRPGLDIPPLFMGGTGSRSEMEIQPDFLPDALEAGTPNTHGLAGLAAGLAYVEKTGLKAVREHDLNLVRIFLSGLAAIPGIRAPGPVDAEDRTAVVSVLLPGWSPSDLAFTLDREYGIQTRAGLHCAPRAHRTLGTFPSGTVRFSFGWFNTANEIQAVLAALTDLAERRPDAG